MPGVVCACFWMVHHRLTLLVILVAAGIINPAPCLAFFSSRATSLSRRSAATGSSSNLRMSEGGNKRSIVVVGLNGALQRTIVFKPPKGLHVGHVNRASSVGSGIGGKGQNVCVALRTLAEGGGGEGVAGGAGEVDVTLAHFAGGKSGE